MNKVLIGVLVLVVLGGGAFFVMNSQKKSSEDKMVKEVVEVSPKSPLLPTATATADKVPPSPKVTADQMEKSAVKTFNVSGGNFSFSVKEMRVKQGDTVKVVFSNVEGFHDWRLDEFKVATKVIGEGKTETVQFIADKKGTFEYYCGVGAHRANGMKGNLVVE